ncbi:acyltransferase [Agromyces rhizosphaerae]|uniref:Acyltransferase n=1 Tax=Agromyces rhizosphaerae TaxID=88374 RepID=A0A9W6CYE7_9MICO|nr:acyltransferase [Agromyces rhizosphaerae]GLI27950.1 acyltransferase [Agromyces rhizosphaerae]
MSAARWRGLDGLRGVAVIAVVLFHAGLAPGGFLGVDVFFVLSGFLITRLLRNEYDRTGTIRLARFTARRLLRLYPALLAACTFVMTVALVTGRAVPELTRDVVVSLTYTSNLFAMQGGLLDHTWTLSLEEQFYLVWPALLLLALWSRAWWGWLPVVALIATILVLDLLPGAPPALHSYVRAMGLPLGCALAFAGPRTLAGIGRLAPIAAVGFVVAVFVPLPAALTTGWPISIGAVVAAPMVALLVSRTVPPAEWTPLRWFGLRSYSLYLWHLPIMSLALHHAPEGVPEWLRVVAGVAASLLVAEASYRWIEQPVLRLRDRRRPAPVPDPGPRRAEGADAE